MERLSVRELWLPDQAQDDVRLAGLAAGAAARGITVRWLDAGAPATDLGDLRVDVLWPFPRAASRGTGGASTGRSRNDGSLVLRVEVAGTRVLFVADIGAEVEARLIEVSESLDADILKVGHHGSRHSTTPEFIGAVSPSHAVVSAPCDAARGLPNQGTLTRLSRAGVSLGWTGRDGAVSFGNLPAGLDSGLVGWADARRCHAKDSTRRPRP